MSTQDPVHVLKEVETDEDGVVYEPGWYFWNETWSVRHGPFATYTEARAAVKYYAVSLDNPQEALQEQCALLLKALKPFARREAYYHGFPARHTIEIDNGQASTSGKCPPISVGDLREALSAVRMACGGKWDV